jgi:hypothetical protein
VWEGLHAPRIDVDRPGALDTDLSAKYTEKAFRRISMHIQEDLGRQSYSTVLLWSQRENARCSLRRKLITITNIPLLYIPVSRSQHSRP